jgi:spectinomycin phosphotransferase
MTMLTEPMMIERTVIQTALQKAYGLTLHTLTFVPKGETSWGYIIDTADGRRYFLKIFGSTITDVAALSLTYHLAHDCHIETVTSPLPMQSGDVVLPLHPYQAALFPYIDGQTLAGRQPTPRVARAIGQALARIHACVDTRAHCRRVEQFEITIRDRLLATLHIIADEAQVLEGYKGAVRALLAPRVPKLRDQLDLFHQVQQDLRKRELDLVVCHGDPTPGNIIVASDGHVALIDWDDVLLAPKEKDLMFFLDDDSQDVIAGYERVAGSIQLNQDILRFYQYQWTLGAITTFSSRIIFENTSDAQNAHDLEELKLELER